MSTNAKSEDRADRSEVLTKALSEAGSQLGLNQKQIGAIIGKDQSSISRGTIKAGSKSGELALMLIRIYRALYVLLGGNQQQMKHWMHTENLHVKGIPAEIITNIQGLVNVTAYVDAMRGKI